MLRCRRDRAYSANGSAAAYKIAIASVPTTFRTGMSGRLTSPSAARRI